MISSDKVLTGSYDYGLAVLSVVIAIFASNATLDLGQRLTAAQNKVTKTSQQKWVQNVIELKAAFEKLAGDGDPFGELARVLKTECPTILRGVHRAVGVQDFLNLEHQAPTVKGLAANLGASSVSATAHQIELTARSADTERAIGRIEFLEVEVDRLFCELEVFAQDGERNHRQAKEMPSQ